MDEERIIGYHSTKKTSAKDILKDGFTASEAREGHWLGKGIYLYENIYYAVEWGIIFFIVSKDNFREYSQKCSILKVVLNYKNREWLDLNDPIGFRYYLEIVKNLEERFPEKIEKIKRDSDIEVIRLIEEIEEVTGERYISEFDFITADYPKDIYKKGNQKIEGNFLPCIQKQICIKNEEIIQDVKEVNLRSSKIKKYFNIISENRKEIKNEKQPKVIRKTSRKNQKYSR